MSNDAAILVRRTVGPALTGREIADSLCLPRDPDEVVWQQMAGADSSLFSVRLSAQRGDRMGPAVGNPPEGDNLAEREYDCYLHLTIDQVNHECCSVSDSMRDFCRYVVSKLHAAWGDIETACTFEDLYSYRIDLTSPSIGPVEIDLWLGSAEQPSRQGFSFAEVANQAACRAIPSSLFQECRPGRYIASASAAGDSVMETLALRSEELVYFAGARSLHWPSTMDVNGFARQVIAGVAQVFDRADLAMWINGNLVRSEIELTKSG